MTKEYWIKFYKGKHILRFSNFAKFVIKFIKNPIRRVCDVGCGNGRDSYYLAKKWNTAEVVGVDYANKPQDKKNVVFVKKDIRDLIQKDVKFDLLYCRFFIHTIDDRLFDSILKWGIKWVAIEVRSDKDKNKYKVFGEHERYYRTTNQLINNFHFNGYEIRYLIEDKNLAKFQGENPIIIRIIAKKKLKNNIDNETI